jgi:hypothetical protein
MSVSIHENGCLERTHDDRGTSSSVPRSVVIRELVAPDTSQIAAIASRTSGFTVPSAYVIWMLAETQKPFCRVAVSDRGRILAYILAFRTTSSDSLFVWQMGIQSGLRSQLWPVLYQLCVHCHSDCKTRNVRRLFFTAPRGARLRLIEKLVLEVTASRISLVSGSNPPQGGFAVQEDFYNFTLHPHARS